MSKSKTVCIPYWVLIVGALLPAAMVCGQAQAQDCSTTLTNNVGDTISVSGQLKSTDPDELDENEGLAVVSSGGELADATTVYNTWVPFKPFTAKQANETISGYDGEDGDETCAVSAMAGTSALDYKTRQQAVEANEAVGHAGFVIATAGVVCLIVKVCAAAGPSLTIAGFMMAGAGEKTGSLAKDPPDPNYKEVALPVVASDVGDEGRAQHLPASLDQAFHDFDHNGKVIINLEQVIVTTVNRVSGARAAGDKHWEHVQFAMLKDYKKELGATILDEVQLSVSLSKAIRSAGMDYTIQPSDAQNFIDDIEQNGLSSKASKLLAGLGFTADDITLIEGTFTLQDPDSVDGSFSSFLADPAYLHDLKNLGNALINR